MKQFKDCVSTQVWVGSWYLLLLQKGRDRMQQMGEERRRIHCCAVHYCFQQTWHRLPRQCTQSAHDHRSCLHHCAQRPQLSPSQTLLPVCVCAGEGSELNRRLSSRVSISTRIPGGMDEQMDGWMDGGWRKEIRSQSFF
jgi:hypothetical protein